MDQERKDGKDDVFAFGAGEPDGIDKDPQDSMFFYAGDRYKLHDVNCDQPGGYINFVKLINHNPNDWFVFID